MMSAITLLIIFTSNSFIFLSITPAMRFVGYPDEMLSFIFFSITAATCFVGYPDETISFIFLGVHLHFIGYPDETI